MLRICMQDLADFVNQDSPGQIKHLEDFMSYNLDVFQTFNNIVRSGRVKLSTEIGNRPYNEMTEQFTVFWWMRHSNVETTLLILQWLSQSNKFIHREQVLDICTKVCITILNHSIDYYTTERYLGFAFRVEQYLTNPIKDASEFDDIGKDIVRDYCDAHLILNHITAEDNVAWFCLKRMPWAAYTFYRDDTTTKTFPIELRSKIEKLLEYELG